MAGMNRLGAGPKKPGIVRPIDPNRVSRPPLVMGTILLDGRKNRKAFCEIEVQIMAFISHLPGHFCKS